MEQLNISFFRLLKLLLSITVFFLIYLMVLDYIFVRFLKEQQSWFNYLILGVFALPIFYSYVLYKGFPKYKYLVIPPALFMGYIVAYFELLWVATSFHSMLGGKI
jgi:hypothetical protein